MGIDVVRGQGREGAAGLQREVDTELLVEKVRDGEPGTVPLHFHGATTSFSEARGDE